MLFILEGHDGPNTHDLRLSVRAEHLARVQTLQQEQRLVLAGPVPKQDSGNPLETGFAGSLIVADFPDRASAEQWLRDDPYTVAGVFAHTSVRPFRKAFP